MAAIDPALVPAIKSIGMLCFIKDFMTPIWASPFGPPPPRASPILGLFLNGVNMLAIVTYYHNESIYFITSIKRLIEVKNTCNQCRLFCIVNVLWIKNQPVQRVQLASS